MSKRLPRVCALVLLAGCASPRPPGPAPIGPPPPQPEPGAPLAPPVPPAIVFRSLEEAAQAGPGAVGQLLSVPASIDRIDQDGIRLEVCDPGKRRFVTRVSDAARPKVRAALLGKTNSSAGGGRRSGDNSSRSAEGGRRLEDSCATWVVRLDAPVMNTDRWTPATRTTAIDLPAMTPIPDPPPGPQPLTELSLRAVPIGTRVRADVHVTSVNYDTYQVEACDGGEHQVNLGLDRRTMSDAMARVVEQLSPPDPNAGATDRLVIGKARDGEVATPCFAIEAETISGMQYFDYDARPVALRLPDGRVVTNDLAPADAPLGSVLDAHRATGDGVGRKVSAWISIEGGTMNESAAVAHVCGASHDRVVVRFEPSQKLAVRSLLARHCMRTTLLVEGPRDEASGIALTTRLLATDESSRSVSVPSSRDPHVTDKDPLVAAALDGTPARGGTITVRGTYHARDGRGRVSTQYGGIAVTEAPAVKAELARLLADPRTRGGEATFRLRLDGERRDAGLTLRAAEILSVGDLPMRPAWTRKAADFELSLAVSRIEREVVGFATCDGKSHITLRVPRALDPLLRAIGEPPFPFPPEVKASMPPPRCAKVAFRTTPADPDAYGLVTAITGVAPEQPTPVAADLQDAFDVERGDPTGKTAALTVTNTDVEARGIVLWTEGYASGQGAARKARHQGPRVLLPLLTPQDRAMARAFASRMGTRAVFRLEGAVGMSSPTLYRASVVSILAPGTTAGPRHAEGRSVLGEASLADDAEGRVLDLSVTVVRAKGLRLGVSVDGTVTELDLTVPAEKAALAARIPSSHRRGRVVVKLVSRDGVCREGREAGCWAAELVDVR